MKKLLCILLSFAFVLTTTARNDVTKFLGISVDGTLENMILKLKQKGFENVGEDWLKGFYNGRLVTLTPISLRDNKVCRIMIIYYTTNNDKDIIKQYNSLCEQFCENENYDGYLYNLEELYIPENENIADEIMKDPEKYKMGFRQATTNLSDPPYFKNEAEKEQWYKNSIVVIDFLEHNRVWFKIYKDSEYISVKDEKYVLVIYYDNLLNVPQQGDDL